MRAGIAGRERKGSFTILPHRLERMAGTETNLYGRRDSNK